MKTCEFKHFPNTDPKSGDTDFCKREFIEALIVSLLTILRSSCLAARMAAPKTAVHCASSKGHLTTAEALFATAIVIAISRVI